jgi:hypothetical protein
VVADEIHGMTRHELDEVSGLVGNVMIFPPVNVAVARNVGVVVGVVVAAIALLEALIVGPETRDMSNMPFAEHPAAIPCGREHLGNGRLPERHALEERESNRRLNPAALRILPRQQRHARRAAHCAVGVKIRESHSLRRQTIKMRGAMAGMSVATQVAVSEIVD